MANADETGMARHDFDAWMGRALPHGPRWKFKGSSGWWTTVSAADLRAAFDAGRASALAECAGGDDSCPGCGAQPGSACDRDCPDLADLNRALGRDNAGKVR